jgi:hypothetical protein
MVSSGMLRRVALVRTDVSEELSTSFIRVTRIGELGTMLAVTSNQRMLRRNTIPEDAVLHSHRGENLKSNNCRIRVRSATVTVSDTSTETVTSAISSSTC